MKTINITLDILAMIASFILLILIILNTPIFFRILNSGILVGILISRLAITWIKEE